MDQTGWWQIHCKGKVQGVGFRPYAYQLAEKHHLRGKIYNTISGVKMDLYTSKMKCEQVFKELLKIPKPAQIDHATYKKLNISELPPKKIYIAKSPTHYFEKDEVTKIQVDMGICLQCLDEIKNPNNRRYRYFFNSCTYCGPRFSLIRKLPFDRQNTSMDTFKMCPSCIEEYENSNEKRRFHSQLNSCIDCGPTLYFQSGKDPLSKNEEAFEQALKVLSQGGIVAVKGLGGYHLILDATNEESLKRLRQQRPRPKKPLAIMIHDLHLLQDQLELEPEHRRLWADLSNPIVLIPKKIENFKLSWLLSFDLPQIGLLAPPSALHYMLANEFDRPLVMTSGNRKGECLLHDDVHAKKALGDMVDGFLWHDRAILHPLDDSVVQLTSNSLPMTIRCSRGLAPLYLENKKQYKGIGLGGHGKVSFSLTTKSKMILSPYYSSLEYQENEKRVQEEFNHLADLHRVNVSKMSLFGDMHSEYSSYQLLNQFSIQEEQVNKVQHHHGHFWSCMEEHQLWDEKIVGLVADGSGVGNNSQMWGGEIFYFESGKELKHYHAIRPYRYWSDERSIRDGKKILYALGRHLAQFTGKELHPLLRKIYQSYWNQNDLKCIEKLYMQGSNKMILWSSLGRLFDGVSALLGLCSYSFYEGQAACELEALALREMKEVKVVNTNEIYNSWECLFIDLVEMLANNYEKSFLAYWFHVEITKYLWKQIRSFDCSKIILTGGCMQNRLLLKLFDQLSIQDKVKVYWPNQIPANDQGLSIGQLIGGNICAWPSQVR